MALAGRWLSVILSTAALRRWEAQSRGAVSVLTWGGLRGGIAVALALSLLANEYRPFILSITYVVVVFSIIELDDHVADPARRARAVGAVRVGSGGLPPAGAGLEGAARRPLRSQCVGSVGPVRSPAPKRRQSFPVGDEPPEAANSRCLFATACGII